MIRFTETARSIAARRRALLACTALLALAAGAGTAGAQPVSPAEVLLFETDHLARTRAPATLTYDFRKVSNVEAGFTDTVELGLPKEGGRLHARLRLRSGERQREAHGDPPERRLRPALVQQGVEGSKGGRDETDGGESCRQDLACLHGAMCNIWADARPA